MHRNLISNQTQDLFQSYQLAHSSHIFAPQDMITVSHPLHLYRNRLITFTSGTTGVPEEIARAGFFYIEATKFTIQCAFCHGKITDSTGVFPSPLTDHGKFFPACPLLLDPRWDDETTAYSFSDIVGPKKIPHSLNYGIHDRNFTGKYYSFPIDWVQDLALCVHKRPKYPDFVSPQARMKSFRAWPADSHQSPLNLVEAGFFYDKLSRCTVCFHCGGMLYNWQGKDEPWEEHAKWFSFCDYVHAIRGVDFVNAALQKSIQDLSP